MEEFLKSLGINGNFTKDGDSLIMDIDGSNKYAAIYSKLEKSDLVDEDPNASNIVDDASTIQFISDDFVINLIGDLDADTYRLVMKEL